MSGAEGRMGEKRGIIGPLLSLVTVLITIFGAGVAYLEFRDAQQRERIERVFRYSDMLQTEAATNASVNALGDRFIEERPDLIPKPADPKDDPVILWFKAKFAAEPALLVAVDRMLLFYDALAVCVAEGLCDERTAKALFTQQVAGFASTVHQWVAFRNKQYFVATGIQSVCLRNRFCGGVTECTGLPARLKSCNAAAPPAAAPAPTAN
jgi:hypothetical protein